MKKIIKIVNKALERLKKDMNKQGHVPSGGFRQTVSTVSVSLASDANDEIKMSSKLNAESIGDWACTMANGIKGEPVRGGRKRGREHLPLPVRSGC